MRKTINFFKSLANEEMKYIRFNQDSALKRVKVFFFKQKNNNNGGKGRVKCFWFEVSVYLLKRHCRQEQSEISSEGNDLILAAWKRGML